MRILLLAVAITAALPTPAAACHRFARWALPMAAELQRRGASFGPARYVKKRPSPPPPRSRSPAPTEARTSPAGGRATEGRTRHAQRHCERECPANVPCICPANVPVMSLQYAAADPLIWTHDHVIERIGGGLKAVVLSSERLGPKAYGSSWPATFRELPPLAELEQWLELRREFEAAIHARNERPSAEDITLADEAIAWPTRYLADPLQRDAVWLTARCIGFGHKLERILRERRKVADLMVEQRKLNGAPDVIRIYEDDAEDAAAKVVAWANKAIADGPRDRARVARIRKGARILFGREIRKAKAVERLTFVHRSDVMPGKLFNQSRVHHHRIAGVETIMAGLDSGRRQGSLMPSFPKILAFPPVLFCNGGIRIAPPFRPDDFDRKTRHQSDTLGEDARMRRLSSHLSRPERRQSTATFGEPS